MTFRLVVVSLWSPGQSPVLPVACRIGVPFSAVLLVVAARCVRFLLQLAYRVAMAFTNRDDEEYTAVLNDLLGIDSSGMEIGCVE